MKKRTKIVILIVAIVVAVGILLKVNLLFLAKETPKENTKDNEIAKNDKEVINQIKEEINATADSDMYQVEEEYDGRKIVQIKPNIQFETALAGILKNGQPQENEIQNLLQNKPAQNGIWIAKQSRDKFLNLLTNNNVNNYAINEEGYLYAKEEPKSEISKEIKNAIHANQVFILDIAGVSYIRDEMTGEIVEYPFEKMEPYQVLDSYQEGDHIILEITTNEKGKLSNQEILNEILWNMKGSC